MTTDADPSTASGPSPVAPPPKRGFVWRVRNYFLTGLIVTAPIIITGYIAWHFVDWVDELVRPILPFRYRPEAYLPFDIPGLGLVIVGVTLTLVGFLAANILGRTLVRFGEGILNRMPVVRSIYFALKQIFETVFSQSGESFKEVVLIEYPRKGIWTIAFVTNRAMGEIQRKIRGDAISVFVPTTPNPTSGFVLFLPREDCVTLQMTVEEGLKLVISGGVLAPPDRDGKSEAEYGRAIT